MKQSFLINGMTCEGCQNFVKQKIESIEEVINAGETELNEIIGASTDCVCTPK